MAPTILAVETSCDPPSPAGFGRASETAATILAVETSCDETAAAITRGAEILSSVKYTQMVHAQWGGVVPSLARRAHEERIEEIINLAMTKSQIPMTKIDAMAVTVGPGLAIALEVGIKWAKKLALEWNKPLIGVNHIEGHILSSLITHPSPSLNLREGNVFVTFPALGLVVSGGHTQLILVEEIGKYKILVQSLDDDIGEALDKGARMLGLPYPGGPALEKAASAGDPKKYKLPLPMAGKEGKAFSYSGLKTAFFRLISNIQSPISNQDRADLAASYQEMVFKHLIRTMRINVQSTMYNVQDLLVGGGVIANRTLRNKLDELGKEMGIAVHYPQNMTLCTDNAAMIGVAAGWKYLRGEFTPIDQVDRKPRWKVDES